jgi:7-cyano-7-deazaguanine synthase
MTEGILVVSGGMDSVTMAYLLADNARDPRSLLLVSFDYGQRHAKELEYAAHCAYELRARHQIVNMAFLGHLLHGSALTARGPEVPDGHYADETMKQTVVPNRNMIMLAIATGIAVAEEAGYVATAVHAGDHFIYPDCRPGFIDAMQHAILAATADGFGHWSGDYPLVTPFVNLGKHEIVRVGDSLGVDYANTWSCYKGGEIHCGRCGTCVERKEAFRLAEVEDPTEYVDKEYLNA